MLRDSADFNVLAVLDLDFFAEEARLEIILRMIATNPLIIAPDGVIFSYFKITLPSDT